MKSITKIFILIAFSILFSCNSGENKKKDLNKYKEPLLKINKYLVNEDQERIKSYINRKKWDMTQTETGLWYMIYENGEGEQAQVDDIITLKFTLELLDGTLCYSSDSIGLKKFKVEKSDVEGGLHEGILYLHEGDKARFIMPPYLAHGLLGDDYKIPGRATIVYNVEVVKIN